ncbi:MAG: helix-turn-helix domain-containing protein [Solirubrobacteraceae bacterium]
MADENPVPEDDPWLTLAEIAEELRMSPATIRSWISKGTLRAMRAGQRKWLVRRSELDRMLAGADTAGPDDPHDAPDWRAFDTIAPPHRSPHWTDPEAVEHVSPGGWLGFVESTWRDALRASVMAPPNREFIVRIRDIAEAAARKAAALANIDDEEPGAWWQRQSRLPGGYLSYELRPGGARPGPAELWARFDRAVEQLGRAMGEHSVQAEQRALEEVSLVLHEIVDALLDEEGRQWPPPVDGREGGDEDASGEADEACSGGPRSVS